MLHGQIFDDPFLDLFQSPVIFIEHLTGGGQILTNARFFAPRQADQRFDEVAHDRRLGRHRRHQPQFFQFCLNFGHALLAHASIFGLFLQLLDIIAFLTLTQLFLDGFDLLIEVILALALFHLAFNATANAFFNLENIDFRFKLRK